MTKWTWGAVWIMAIGPALAEAGMVSQRWCVDERAGHPGTIRFESLPDSQALMVCDLSALPKQAKVYGARVLVAGMSWKDRSFDLVPARKVDGKLSAAGEALPCVGPYYRWLDATAAVREALQKGGGPMLLWLRRGPQFDRNATILEIAYEADQAAELPRQVSDVGAIYRKGQVFITFKEIDPPDGGKDVVTWGELAGKMKADYYGAVPSDEPRQVRYRVYRGDKPLTPETIGSADLVAEVLPGSGINTRIPLLERRGVWAVTEGVLGSSKKFDAAQALRLAPEPGKPVGPGHGLYVHTVARQGKAYYAVLTAVDGVVNGIQVAAGNTAGPVEERVEPPEPVMFKELIWDRKDDKYVEQWFSFWTTQPLSPWPVRYDLVVGCPRPAPDKLLPVTIVKEGWNSFPHPPNPQRSAGIYVSHTSDQPIDFRCGLHDSIGTIKGFDAGKWQPFHGRRQDAILQWVLANWPADPRRVTVNMGAWGWHELTRGNTYAHVHGWVQPEMTKGFLSWDWAHAVWGGPEMYVGRNDAENPWLASDATAWVLAHPAADMPYLQLRTSVGAHLTEMGWPPFPRFFAAMMKTKRAFTYCPHGPIKDALADGTIVLRPDQTMPAFAHCSLDDNPGEGELRSGDGLGAVQINGYLLWETQTITDLPKLLEMTIYLPEQAPRDDCTVDVTPRRCQKFKAKAGEEFTWTNTSLADSKQTQSGSVKADRWGLVTVPGAVVTKGKNRICITRKD